MQYICISHRIIWKTLKKILTMISTMISSVMKMKYSNIKKAAKAAGEKSVEMIHVKDINKITGYIRGGCTAIGMKKDYPTVLDESANAQEKIIVSGGKTGIQIELTTEDYLKACKGKTADITLR